MVRPRKRKCVNFYPNITYFKPQGVPLRELAEVELTLDELETLRLSDLQDLSQVDSADRMQIHQSTFQRTLARAREKITNALVYGKSIKIHGGEYKMPNKDGTGPEGKGPKTGRERGNCEGAEPRGRGQGPCGKGMRRGNGRRDCD
jgi:predicted DNA-binding protein (UPF0251 family)